MRQFLIAFQALLRYMGFCLEIPHFPYFRVQMYAIILQNTEYAVGSSETELPIAHVALLSDLFCFDAEGWSKGHRELAPLLILLVLSV